jgi:hypothetical protein
MCSFHFPLSSGAIQSAKDASDALKAINVRAIKILVRRTQTSDDVLVLIRKCGCLFTRFDNFRSSPYVSGGPMLRIVNLAIKQGLNGSK